MDVEVRAQPITRPISVVPAGVAFEAAGTYYLRIEDTEGPEGGVLRAVRLCDGKPVTMDFDRMVTPYESRVWVWRTLASKPCKSRPREPRGTALGPLAQEDNTW
jgi:hypothetical protein